MSTQDPTFEKTTDPALIAKALKRVQRVCKGNGIKTDAVQIENSDLVLQKCKAATYLTLKPKRNQKTANGKQTLGKAVSGAGAVQAEIDKTILDALSDPERRDELLKSLLERDDAGFGITQKAIPMRGLTEDYYWHEGCQTCRTQGKTPCPRCHGQMREQCPQCHGATTLPCNMCRGSGQIHMNGKTTTCTKCQGTGRMGCTLCQRTGKITCRTCRGQGTIACTSCGATGWKTHTVHLNVQAQPHFEFDKRNLPKALTSLLTKSPAKLMASKSVKITPSPIKDDANTLGVTYELRFPKGEIQFSIKGKTIPAQLFGYDAQIDDMIPFLDKVMAQGLDDLSAAAKGKGNVGALIKKASRYRIIGLALLSGSQKSVKETARRLFKEFPFGVRTQTLKTIAIQADQAMALITRKPRYEGLVLGLMIVSVLYGLYYLGPGRALLAPHIHNPHLHSVIDLALIFMGGTLTTLSIQMRSKRALQNALAHLVSGVQRQKLLPKTRASGWWGYAGGLGLYLTMVTLTPYINPGSTPPWYDALQAFIGF